MGDRSQNQDAVRSVLERCRRAGVETYCVCAGSRNSPLVVALGRAEGIRVFSFFEERSAAFFAIGRIQSARRPVAVVTTSGTAAAELLPAAVEAYYQGLPLILITADRPAEFRGSGAPQAIEQVGLFGVYAEAEAEKWHCDRPLHLNLELDEPLAPNDAEASDLKPEDVSCAAPGDGEASADVSDFLTPDTLVILGRLHSAQEGGVLEFLSRTKLPVLAEANSNLRGHSCLAGQEIEGLVSWSDVGRVLRLGGVPCSRLWRDLESHPEIPVCSVSELPFSGLARGSEFRRVCPSLIQGTLDDPPKPVPQSRPMDLLTSYPRSEPALVNQLSEYLPDGALLFLGNSMAIRDWDLAASRAPGNLRVVANRGANGIDGNLSTFFGASAGFRDAWCLVGDLTALYDLAAPWILPQLPSETRFRILVLNNGGGAIFRRVKDLQSLHAEELRLMTNPHEVRLRSWAAMWGMDYASWHGVEEFPLNSETRAQVIEVVPDSAQTEAFWNACQDLDPQTLPRP